MQLFCVWARSYFGPADIGLVLFCCIKARHTESATERAGHLTRHFTSGRFSSRSCTGSRPTEAPCVTGNGRCGKNMKKRPLSKSDVRPCFGDEFLDVCHCPYLCRRQATSGRCWACFWNLGDGLCPGLTAQHDKPCALEAV